MGSHGSRDQYNNNNNNNNKSTNLNDHNDDIHDNNHNNIQHSHNIKWLQTIDRIYYINLSHRTDRNNQIKTWLKDELYIPSHKIIRWNAYADKITPRRGCTLSHLSIFQHAKLHQYDRILVMEDDLTRNPTISVEQFGHKLKDSLNYLDCIYYQTWNVLFIGMTPIHLIPSYPSPHHQQHHCDSINDTFSSTAYTTSITPTTSTTDITPITPITDTKIASKKVLKVPLRCLAQIPSSIKDQLFQVKQALAMCGYIVNANYYDTMISIFQESLKKEIEHDLTTQLYQSKHLWFGLYPPLAIQRADYSDIEKRFVDYTALQIEGIKLKPR